MSKPLTVQGEVIKNVNSSLLVEQSAFFAHLLNIAMIWSNGHVDGLQALPMILKEMCEKDVPAIRTEIAI